MPFTLSHTAAVLPLARGPLVPSALVIGSMAPDIPYFFFAMELRSTTHRAHGVVTVDVLIGLAAFAVWHLLWKRPLAALAPARVRRRLPLDAPVRWGWAVPSVAIGAATHVLWDAFTHLNWSFAGELPWLTESLGGVAVYVWLQYISGVAGLAIVLLWLTRWLRKAHAPAPAATAAGTGTGTLTHARTATRTEAQVDERTDTRTNARGPVGDAGGGLRLPVCAGIAAVSAAGGMLSALMLPDVPDVHTILYYGCVGTIAAAGLALTVYTVWWHVARPAALEL
ncbi:DUF4184 family protein [Actinomadura sp. WMMB 499]|uniref:DUF4184 family protein n=1 Tax=Actinomadura sp. WMMB 499 TaxID=1219491 RepID=UPI001248CCC9|nr:DUF4184 family protein [Actinomadura sp. WMMB 499]QFG21147.1 DUF4184 family protein [Actinomadura sp. WMMB 499]